MWAEYEFEENNIYDYYKKHENKFLCSRDISLGTRILRWYVFLTLGYGVEAWTLKTTEINTWWLPKVCVIVTRYEFLVSTELQISKCYSVWTKGKKYMKPLREKIEYLHMVLNTNDCRILWRKKSKEDVVLLEEEPQKALWNDILWII